MRLEFGVWRLADMARIGLDWIGVCIRNKSKYFQWFSLYSRKDKIKLWFIRHYYVFGPIMLFDLIFYISCFSTLTSRMRIFFNRFLCFGLCSAQFSSILADSFKHSQIPKRNHFTRNNLFLFFNFFGSESTLHMMCLPACLFVEPETVSLFNVLCFTFRLCIRE